MLRLTINAVTSYSGGGLTVLLGYLDAWHENGAQLEITMFASQPDVIAAAQASRATVRVIPFGVGLSLARRLVAQQRTLGPAIDAQRADVVLTTNMLVGRCRASQVVHHQNLLLFEERTLRGAWRHGTKRLLQVCAARRALRRSAANVFISEYLREQAELAVPESRPRNHAILNGLSDEVIERAGRPSPWDGEPHLFAITSEEPHKRNATLVRVLAELVRAHPGVPWRLSVACAGPLQAERRLALELGVAERIDWLGFVDAGRLDELYERSACLLYPTVLEGFGLPPLEAMARRCPVIACDCTALPEVVGDGGVLVEPGNVEGFADAAFRVLDNRSFRDALIERGVRRIAGFRWRESAARLYRVLESVTGRAGSRVDRAC